MSQRSTILKMRNAARNFLIGENGTDGAALIEFTIFAPILMIMIIGLADYGMYIYRMSQVQIATQAGAQYALQRGTFKASAIASAVTVTTCPSGSCSGFTGTITASPAPIQFCGCPSNTGVSQIAAGACTGGLVCASDGSVAGTYVTVRAQATYDSLLPSTLSPYPLVITYSNPPGCPPNTICASATVRIR
jgi:Flp pilus assembly protein TadG